MSAHKLHLYTGSGKGKTTAAMGLALRMLGHGGCVLIGQWMKDNRSGELLALQSFPNAIVLPSPPLHGFVWEMTSEERLTAAAHQTAYTQALAQEIERRQPQCIILDELCTALAAGLVPEDSANALVETSLRYGEAVATGRDAPAWLLARADYISEINSVRHPYDTERLPARKGIEW